MQTGYRFFPAPSEKVFPFVFRTLQDMQLDVRHSDPRTGRIVCNSTGSNGGASAILDITVRPVPGGSGIWALSERFSFFSIDNERTPIDNLFNRVDSALWAYQPAYPPGLSPPVDMGPPAALQQLPPLYMCARTFERPGPTGATTLAFLNGLLFLVLFAGVGSASSGILAYTAVLFSMPYFVGGALLAARHYTAGGYICGTIGLALGFAFSFVVGFLALLLVGLGMWATSIALRNAKWDRLHLRLYGPAPPMAPEE